jgi:hypothetical protein
MTSIFLSSGRFVRCFLLSLFICVPALAQSPGQNLSAERAANIDSRLSWIENELTVEQAPSQWWWNGWLCAYGALTVGQTALFFITDSETTKQDMGVGAVETLLSTAGVLFFTPLQAKTAASDLTAYPSSTEKERGHKLDEAERLLKQSAEDEAFGRSWITHAIGFTASLAGGLVIWKGFDRPFADGVLNFAIAMAITEIQIFTQPSRLIDAYEKYPKRPPVSAALQLSPHALGLALIIRD